jgi:hypothetical protein
MSMQDRLTSPDKGHRPVPVWSCNDPLKAEELRRQIAGKDDKGMGGYFMDARRGLKTEYMSSEWMDAIRIGIEEEARRGLSLWTYDENGWPSGFADGAVNGLGLAYQQKYLRLECARASQDVDCERTVPIIRERDAVAGAAGSGPAASGVGRTGGGAAVLRQRAGRSHSPLPGRPEDALGAPGQRARQLSPRRRDSEGRNEPWWTVDPLRSGARTEG